MESLIVWRKIYRNKCSIILQCYIYIYISLYLRPYQNTWTHCLFFCLLLNTEPSGVTRQLSKDEVGQQARVLLNQFIQDRLATERSEEQVLHIEDLQDPGTPTGQQSLKSLRL